MPGGRPTLLTPQISDYICKAIRAGAPLYQSLGAVNIGKETYHGWMRRGEACEPGDEIFSEFADAIKKAKSEFVVRAVKKLQRAGSDPKYWTAIAWLLERRCPEDFGKRESEEIARQSKKLEELEAKVTFIENAKPHGES